MYAEHRMEVKHKETFWQAEMARMKQEVLGSREFFPLNVFRQQRNYHPSGRRDRGSPPGMAQLDFRCTFQF